MFYSINQIINELEYFHYLQPYCFPSKLFHSYGSLMKWV